MDVATVRDKNGSTCAHLASSWGHLNVLRYCHEELKIDVATGRDKHGQTPADLARSFGHDDVVRYLESLAVPGATTLGRPAAGALSDPVSE
eukprot:1743498-Amphidinium_carterae.1